MPGSRIRVLCKISARFGFSRFPGKPLVKINGIPMIKKIYMQAAKSPILSDLVVATEDKRMIDYCESEGMKVVLTSDNYCIRNLV